MGQSCEIVASDVIHSLMVTYTLTYLELYRHLYVGLSMHFRRV